MTKRFQKKTIFVIGAGIVGACTANQLLQAGHKVVLIEKDAPGSGASSGNAGSIGVASVPPFGMPGFHRKIPKILFDPLFPLVLRWENMWSSLCWFRKLVSASELGRVIKISDARASILAHAEGAYKDLLASLSLQHLISRTGLIHTYQSHGSYLNAEFGISLRKDRGVKLDILSGHEVREMEPAITDSVDAGVFYPDVGTCFDPGGMNKLLVKKFVDRGGEFLREEVKSFELVNDRCENLITDGSKHSCDEMVLTAGAWSKGMAKTLGCDVSLEAERGYHIMVDQSKIPLKIPLVSADYHIAITPMDSEIRVSTMSEFSSVSASQIHQKAYPIMRQARHIVQNIDMKTNSRWVGPRPATPDSLPIIGRSKKFKNVIFAFGHGHLGLSLAPITGKLVTEICNEVKTSIDIYPFSPYRNFTGDHL